VTFNSKQSARREPLCDFDQPRPAPASRCSTPTVHWKRSAGALLVGFGGLASEAIRQGAPRLARSLRAIQHIATRCIRLSRPTLGNDQGCGVVGAGLGGFRCAGRARCGRQCHRTMLSTAERDRTETLRLTFSRPPSRPFQEGRACADRIKVSRAENAVSLQEQDTNRTRKGRLPR
jgi:hypothetical protein